MAPVFFIYVLLAVAAWVKIGPIAGVVAIVGLLLMFFIASQPGTSLWTSGPWSARSRARPPEPPPDTGGGVEKNRPA